MLDLAAAILAGGNTSETIAGLEAETKLSQVFIAVHMHRHMTGEQREELIAETLKYIREHNEAARYPGQRSRENRQRHLEEGIEVPDHLWSEILKL